MKTIEEIVNSKKVMIGQRAKDGINGEIVMRAWKGTFVASTGGGWEHVSVAPFKRSYTPTWDDMCAIKDIFFKDDEAVIQIHPPKAEYVNNVPNCLHLWRCTYKEMVLPPSVFVGVKQGQTMKDVIKDIKEAYEIAGEKY